MLDITRLQNRSVNFLEISDVIKFDYEVYKNTDIQKLSDVIVNIYIKRVTDFSYDMTLNIKGEMTLLSSNNLKEVIYPFNINTTIKVSNDGDEEEEYVKINQNTIDINPIIWQNIMLEIPLRITSDSDSDVPMSGDGWRLIS